MTKKDYELIAGAIKNCQEAHKKNSKGYEAVGGVAVSIMVALENENPRFDRARFMVACGFFKQ